MSNTVDVYAFLCEYFDSNAALVKKFRLNYFGDGTCEILNPDRTKTIMKRIPYPELSLGQLYVGSSVTIFSRQYHIVDYADEGTRVKYEKSCGRALGVMKSADSARVGEAIEALCGNGFAISDLKSVRVDGEVEIAILVASDEDGGEEAIKKFTSTLSPLNISMYISPSSSSVSDDAVKYFGPSGYPSSYSPSECSLCLVKPHVIKDGKLGAIISSVKREGFDIGALQMFYMDRECSVEFMDVYRSVLPQYEDIVKHLIDGPVVAMQIVGDDVVERFREIAGPPNVELAKVIRPNTLRATYGVDFAKNGVHCTDLKEDGGLECKYFFQILSMI